VLWCVLGSLHPSLRSADFFCILVQNRGICRQIEVSDLTVFESICHIICEVNEAHAVMHTVQAMGRIWPMMARSPACIIEEQNTKRCDI